MDETELKIAFGIVGECTCHDGFSSRGLDDPQCAYHNYAADIAEALKSARRAGAEAMREAAGAVPMTFAAEDLPTNIAQQLTDEIRALPLRAVEAASPAAGWRPTHRHYKGGLYQFLYSGHLSDDKPESVIVYRSELGPVWVRPAAEFFGEVDGKRRFDPLPPSPPTTERDARGG